MYTDKLINKVSQIFNTEITEINNYLNKKLMETIIDQNRFFRYELVKF